MDSESLAVTEALGSNNVIAATGKLAKLPCVAKLDNNYFLEWKKDGIGTIYTYYFGTNRGQPTVGFEDRVSHGDDGSLTIHSVSRGDAGVYWCVLKTFNRPADNQIGQKVYLAVHTAPYFVSVPSEEEFRENGQSLSLACKADGIPQPRISWTKGNGTRLETGGRMRSEEGSLEILHLQERDSGKYLCTAENSVGSSSHTTTLRFAQPAVFDDPLKNRTAIDASSLIWKCHARAVPNTITYRWFYGEREVIYHQTLGLRATVQGGDLRISKITRQDKGWYKCAVSNGFGSVKISSAYLDVHYSPEISKLTPALQYVPIGLKAAVKCDVDAVPPASDVTWTKDGRYLNPDEDDRISIGDNGTRLFIQQVENKDEGLYTCQAFNYLGGGNSYEIHVFVEEPPYYVKEPPKEVTRLKGDEVTLECKAGSVGLFKKDGRALPSKAQVFGKTHLRIKDVDARDHGIYQCVVQNRVTVLTRDTLLTVQETVPQAPVNVTLDAGAFEAGVSWSPGYGGRAGDTQSYTLKYRRAGDRRGKWKEVLVQHGTRFTVTHLHPDTAYEFVVVPKNSLGSGFPTEAIITKTKGADNIGSVLPTDTSGVSYFPKMERPVGPRPPKPEKFHVKKEDHRVVFVWDPPTGTHTRIQYYSLEYKENEKEEESQYVESRRNLGEKSEDFRELFTNIRDTTVDFLPGHGNKAILPGETYDFRVKAHSVASFSEPSNTVTYTVPGVSSEMAVVAGIIGGVLFLLLFLLAGCFLAMRGRQNQKRKRNAKVQSNHAQSNGHASYPNGHLDTLDVHYATVTKSNGSLDVPNEGVSGVAKRIVEVFTGTKDSSKSLCHSPASDSPQFPGLVPQKNSISRENGPNLSSSVSRSRVVQQNSNLAEYLSARELKGHATSDDGLDLGGQRPFESSSLSRAAQKHVRFASDTSQTEPVGVHGSVSSTPSKSPPRQYTRDKLLGTIDKLRQHVSDGHSSLATVSRRIPDYPSLPRQCKSASAIPKRNSSLSSESATESPSLGGPKLARNHPGRGAMRHSYSARGSKKRELAIQNHPVVKSLSSSTVGARNQHQIFNAYMDGGGGDPKRDRMGSTGSSSGVTSLHNGSFLGRSRGGVGLPAVFEHRTGPSPSISSSSGISSDEGPGGGNVLGLLSNPITEMLQEKYIFSSQVMAERAIDCGDLVGRSEEDERFKKLRDEFRAVKGRSLPTQLKATVVESEVL